LRGLTLELLAAGLPDEFPKHVRTVCRDLSRWKSDGFKSLPATSGSVRPVEI